MLTIEKLSKKLRKYAQGKEIFGVGGSFLACFVGGRAGPVGWVAIFWI